MVVLTPHTVVNPGIARPEFEQLQCDSAPGGLRSPQSRRLFILSTDHSSSPNGVLKPGIELRPTPSDSHSKDRQACEITSCMPGLGNDRGGARVEGAQAGRLHTERR